MTGEEEIEKISDTIHNLDMWSEDRLTVAQIETYHRPQEKNEQTSSCGYSDCHLQHQN